MEPTAVKAHSTPRDFFLHMGLIVTLYLSVGSLIALLFEIINYKFPDALTNTYYGSYYDPYSSAVRWSIAMLIITFPLFWLISWVLNKDYTADPMKKTVGVRKWLVYLTLFVAGISMMIDLVVLVNTFLGGEISTRFILKVLSVLVVAGLVFGYYIYDLRHYPTGPSKMLKRFLSGAALLILLSIISGFAVMGSPSTQRKLQFDSQRVSDIQNIEQQVISYWQAKQQLPATLDDLRNNNVYGYYTFTDPETKQMYEYKATGNLSFEVCANFSLPSSANQRDMSLAYPAYQVGAENTDWTHEAGHHCFTRTIDPQFYPPNNPQGTGVIPKGQTTTNANPNGPDYSPNGKRSTTTMSKPNETASDECGCWAGDHTVCLSKSSEACI